MLTEEEWNALDDEAPERQFSNYLDYKNAQMKKNGQTQANAVSNDRNILSEKEQIEASRLNLDDKGLYHATKKNGNIEGPGGISYDPYTEKIVRDPDTGAPMKVHKGATNPITNLPYDDYEEERHEVATGNAPKGLEQTVKAEERWNAIPNKTVDETGAKVVDGVRQPKKEEVEEQPKEEVNTEEDTADSIVSSTPSDSVEEEEEKSEVIQEGIEQTKKDKKGRFALKSIFQAYKDGDIDESTRDYMVIDAIATFAKNMGKDFQNIAAAYTGGTIDNERADSLWDQRNKQLSEAGVEQSVREDTNEARSEDESDLDWKAKEMGITTKELQNDAYRITNSLNKLTKDQRVALASEFDKLIAKAPNDTVKANLLAIKSQATGAGAANLDQSDLIAMGSTELFDFLKGHLGL